MENFIQEIWKESSLRHFKTLARKLEQNGVTIRHTWICKLTDAYVQLPLSFWRAILEKRI